MATLKQDLASVEHLSRNDDSRLEHRSRPLTQEDLDGTRDFTEHLLSTRGNVPEVIDGYRALAFGHYELGQNNEAMKAMKRAVKAANTIGMSVYRELPGLQLEYAQLLESEGQLDLAATIAEGAVSNLWTAFGPLDKRTGHAHLELMRLHVRQGKTEKIRSGCNLVLNPLDLTLDEVEKINEAELPRDIRVPKCLALSALVAVAQGDSDTARVYAQKALRMAERISDAPDDQIAILVESLGRLNRDIDRDEMSKGVTVDGLPLVGTPPENAGAPIGTDAGEPPGGIHVDEGPSIASAARAQMKQEAQSRQLLRDAFSSFPETGIAIRFSQPKLIRTIDAARAEIGVTVEYSLTRALIDAARQAALRVSTRHERLRSLDAVVPDPTEPAEFNRTGIAFVGSATLDFYHLRPEHYWIIISAMLTGEDWLLPAPFNVYQFPKKGTYERPFQVTMPRLEVEFVDSQGRVYHYEECEVFGDSLFLNEKRRFAYRGISQANDHRLLQFAQGLVTFVYFRTGVREERRIDLGKAAPSTQEVMLLPPSGYEPEVDSYSNGKFAMVLRAEEVRQREYRFTVTLDQLEKLHRLRGRVVSPLKKLAQQ